jgi:hypothetical protein
MCGRSVILAGIFADMFVDPASDPRGDPPPEADERAMLVAFLRWQRHTLELKCSGPDAAFDGAAVAPTTTTFRDRRLIGRGRVGTFASAQRCAC